MKLFCALCNLWSQYCKCKTPSHKQYPDSCKCPPLDWDQQIVPEVCSNYTSIKGDSGPCKCGHDKFCHKRG